MMLWFSAEHVDLLETCRKYLLRRIFQSLGVFILSCLKCDRGAGFIRDSFDMLHFSVADVWPYLMLQLHTELAFLYFFGSLKLLSVFTLAGNTGTDM